MRYLSTSSGLLISLTLICLYFCERTQEVSSFWFTDDSLNYRPAQVSSIKIDNNPAPEANPNIIEKQSLSSSVTQVNYADGESFQKSRIQNDSWISPASRAVQFNGQLGNESGRQQQQQQQQKCLCNIDLIHNYTNTFISRWLGSPNAASQLRATLLGVSLSNSTGANINRRAMHLASQEQMVPLNSSIRNNNHLGAWVRSRSHGGNNNLQKQQQQQHHSIGQRQAQAPTASTLRGPQGPRGEIGPRGERGRAGFLRVRDRDALFDLANTSSATPNQIDIIDDSSSPGLVFVDSEQMLVVLSASGWRPVQLLPAIHDFRRTIAKFSLNSPSERRKLLSLSPKTTKSTNSRVPLVTLARPEAQQIRQLIDNNIAGEVSASGALATDITSDLDDDDDDEDADVNQDNDDDDDDDDEEEEEEEDDEEEEDGEAGNYTKSIRIEPDGSSNEILTRRSSSIRRPVIMGRSAVTSSLITEAAAPIPAESSSTKEEKLTSDPQYDSGQGMKLRVAALNEPFSGNVHGIRGADFECRRHAAKANIRGSFRAFLASGFQNLNEVVRYNVLKYPLINLRGETLANSWHDFFKQPARILNPLSKIYSFDGRHVASDSNWPNKLVWHGANNKFGYRDSLHNCDGWHSDSLSKFGSATPIHPPSNNLNRRLNIKQQPKQRKRSLDQNSLVSDQRQHHHRAAKSNGFVLESIDKYPCRMPLVMLCIETIGQQTHPIKQQKQLTFESSEDMENVIS